VGIVGVWAFSGIACSSESADPPRDERRVTLETSHVASVVESNDAFAWSLYDRVRTAPGNLFFSPFSVSAALAMTLRGARGRTADEMRAVLHVTDETTYHPAFGALLADLGGDHTGRGYELFVGNALFGQTGYPFSSDFIESSASLYSAPLTQVDFADPEGARTTINGWVSDQTHDAIPSLLEPGTLDPLTRLVLANAIYFEAQWLTAFDPDDTVAAPFRLATGATESVSMMSATAPFRSADASGTTLVELPYEDDEIVMIAALPQSQTLDATEATLAPALDRLVGVEPRTLTVRLPQLDLTGRLPLKTALVALGMPTAFDPTAADFSGIAAPEAGSDDLYLQASVHQAHVEIDERGTRAAAATAVVVGTRSVPPTVTFDQPFVFLIRDRLTGSILFMGRVEDPLAPSD
jgi:serpin B